jgi:adenosylhomocysteine nucleosidase
MSLEADFDAVEGLLGADASPPASASIDRDRRAVIAFVGMAFEARIAAGPGIHVFSRDARHELEAAVASASRHGYRGIISFGVAGGLAEQLRPGDWVVASEIAEAQGSRPTDAAWSQKLLHAIGGAHHAPVIGVDTPVADPAKKRELHRLSGAAAVDMESHIVARLAAAHGLAFTALRVIVDPAHRVIPQAALKGMGAGPRADGVAVMRDLLARPSQLALLLRISLDAYIARSAMQRLRRRLGPHFAFTDPSMAALAAPELALSGLTNPAIAHYRSPA